jgi:hypothetical protein
MVVMYVCRKMQYKTKNKTDPVMHNIIVNQGDLRRRCAAKILGDVFQHCISAYLYFRQLASDHL